jgi:hypothetical protein
LAEERAVLQEQLQQESEERAEAEEVRERIAMRKAELEEMLQDMGARLEDDEERILKAAEEKKKLQDTVRVRSNIILLCSYLFDIVGSRRTTRRRGGSTPKAST